MLLAVVSVVLFTRSVSHAQTPRVTVVVGLLDEDPSWSLARVLEDKLSAAGLTRSSGNLGPRKSRCKVNGQPAVYEYMRTKRLNTSDFHRFMDQFNALEYLSRNESKECLVEMKDFANPEAEGRESVFAITYFLKGDFLCSLRLRH